VRRDWESLVVVGILALEQTECTMKRIWLLSLVTLFLTSCGSADGDAESLVWADLGSQWTVDAVGEDHGPGQPGNDSASQPEFSWTLPDVTYNPDERSPPPPPPDTQVQPDTKPPPPPPDSPCHHLQAKESLNDLAQSYSAGNWKNVLYQIADRRYDPGHFLLTNVQDEAQLPNWVQTNSFQNLVMSTSTAIHETNHMYGFELGGWNNYGFFVCEEVVLIVPWTETPPRSLIYSSVNTGLSQMLGQYADLYLTGTMGNQGFHTLLDELNAYIHSAFVDYQLVDQMPMGRSISSLDGLAAFMYFTELYLKYVRTNNPGAYNSTVANAQMADVIITMFNRAEWIIDASADQAHKLNLMADPVFDQVFHPDLYSEIELLKN